MISPLVRNAIMAVLEALCAAATALLLIRVIIADLGVVALGVWAVVAATLSFSQVADISLAGALQKFVPGAMSQGHTDSAIRYIETALAVVIPVYLLIAVIGEPLFSFLLRVSISGDGIAMALQILPYSLLVFWLANVAMVPLSALAGLQRYDLRSAISIVGILLQFTGAILLIPRYGILGLVIAQILQNAFMLACGYIVLRRTLPGIARVPLRFSRAHFREMVSYGSKIQLTGIALFLFEPTTKLILSNVSGLAWVGYYEMATRLAKQVRQLIVSASQVTVPALAHAQERDVDGAFYFYVQMFKVHWILAWPVMGTLAALTPAIAALWFGNGSNLFVVMALPVIAAWAVNLTAAPAYFMSLASGKLRWNLIGMFVMSTVNTIFAFLLGYLIGGWGVIAAATGGLAAGSICMIVGNHLQAGGRLRQILDMPSAAILVMSVAGAAVSLLAFHPAMEWLGMLPAILAVLAIMAVSTGIPISLHPISGQILRSLLSRLSHAR